MSRYPNHTLRAGRLDVAKLAFAVIAVSTLGRLLFAAGLDFGVDEAYAVAVGRTFQWSFFDHPPLAFWTAGAMQALAGADAPHWLIRLPFVVEFSLTLYLVYRLGDMLFSPAAGLWGIILLAVAPFFFASAGSWIVPDGPVDLFLSLSALLFARILYAELTPRAVALNWIGLGVAFGLATLSKYHAFLFAFGALVFLLATPHRRHLLRPAPWIAGLIALALFSPVIVWNAQHGWISLVFQSGRSSGGNGLHPANSLAMLAGAAAYLWPWTLVILICALVGALTGRPAWVQPPGTRQRALFLAALALPAVLLFTLLPTLGNRGLPHWPMPGWLFVFPLAGAALAETVARGARWPAWLAGISAALLAFIGIAVVTLLQSTTVDAMLEARFGLFGNRGGLTPLVNEAADWRGLRAALAERGLELGPDRFIVTSRWYAAARIAADLGPGPDVAVFAPDARGFAFLTDQRALIGKDAIVISEPLLGYGVDTLAPFFEAVDPPQPLEITVAGGVEKRLWVTLAHRLKVPFPLRYGATPASRS